MIEVLLRLAARALVALHPPGVRERFGDELRADWARLLDDELGRPGGARRVMGRLVRDGVGLPTAWAAWTREETAGTRAPDAGGLRGVLQDLGYGARSLLRDRRFTGAAVAVLAVGLGLTSAVASVLDAYLVRGMPFPESDRIAAVETVAREVAWSDPALDRIFEIPVSWDLDAFTLVDGDRPRQVRGQWVAPGFFEVFGIRPALGRGFLPEEGGAGGASVAVIGHRLWQERYGGDPDILGRTLPAFTSDRPDDAESFTVVGVLPEDFWFFNGYTEMIVPLRAENPVYMGRLAPGVTLAEAERRLDRLARARGWTPAAGTAGTADGGRLELSLHQERYLRGLEPTLLLLAGAVGLVLLVTSGNVAMLLVVRAGGRAREFGVRRALGATRRRLVRQLVGEGLLLTTASTALGFLLGAALVYGAGDAMEAGLGLAVPGGVDALGISGRVLALGGGLALAAGLVFGIVPLLGSLGGRGAAGISRRGRGAVGGRGRALLRDGVVVAELALSLALLIAAGLTVRSAIHLSTVDLGFRHEELTVAEVTVRRRSYPEPSDRLGFQDRLLARARALPGVEGAALALRVPFAWGFNTTAVEDEATAGTAPSELPRAVTQLVGPGYFRTMGIPVLRGRPLTAEDGPESEPVAVVSESLTDAFWPGQDPLGRRVRPAPTPGEEEGPWYRVVGVVPDVWNSLPVGRAPDVYVPLSRFAPATTTVVLRRRPGAASPLRALEEAVLELDPDVPVADAVDLGRAARDAVAPARSLAMVLSGFGVFAVVLSVLGLYGVIAYATGRRSREVAVRMALGADAGRVTRSFLLRGVAVVVPGVALGLAGGWALGRALAGRLQGVSASDPVTFLGLAALLGAAALVATWIPARRAAGTDPMRVLGSE